jgi:hypothetical protein
MIKDINYVMLVTFIEENWKAFVQHFGTEAAADETLEALREEAGMS